MGEIMNACSFDGCDRIAPTDLCRSHAQQRRRGQMLKALPVRGLSEREEFDRRIRRDGDCWIWTTGINTAGYGHFRVQGKLVRAHRYSYETHNGHIPAGMVIDHTCRNRSCVNPAHLQAVTAQQNSENLALKTKSSSGYRGIYWEERTKSYAVKVMHDGMSHWVGRFPTLTSAIEAVRLKRLQLHTNNLVDYIAEAKEARRPVRHIMRPGRDDWDDD